MDGPGSTDRKVNNSQGQGYLGLEIVRAGVRSGIGRSGPYEMTDTHCTHPITEYGVLVDFDTEERLRPATEQERDLLDRFAKRHPTSLSKILVGERRCYIDPST